MTQETWPVFTKSSFAMTEISEIRRQTTGSQVPPTGRDTATAASHFINHITYTKMDAFEENKVSIYIRCHLSPLLHSVNVQLDEGLLQVIFMCLLTVLHKK